jgi:aryl-alcohol dehydrogenase-like predicted oxidoreductase
MGPQTNQRHWPSCVAISNLGGNFLDTAEIYGPYKNEELIARFLREVPRDRIILATKFGFRIDPNGQFAGVDSSASNVRKACEGSLRRLGVDFIDLYYQHRVDPGVPIEETVGAMADLVRAGKVRALGLSETGVGTLRRATAVQPISAATRATGSLRPRKRWP